MDFIMAEESGSCLLYFKLIFSNKQKIKKLFETYYKSNEKQGIHL